MDVDARQQSILPTLQYLGGWERGEESLLTCDGGRGEAVIQMKGRAVAVAVCLAKAEILPYSQTRTCGVLLTKAFEYMP